MIGLNKFLIVRWTSLECLDKFTTCILYLEKKEREWLNWTYIYQTWKKQNAKKSNHMPRIPMWKFWSTLFFNYQLLSIIHRHLDRESQGGKHPICHQLVQMAIGRLVLNSSNLCKIWCFMLVYKNSDRCSQAWKYMAIKSLKKHLSS